MRVQNWMIEIGIVVVAFGSAIGLAGCSDQQPRNREPVVQYEVEAEGCVVKYIDNPKGYNFFIAKCPSSSEVITHQRASGKTTTTEVTVVTSDNLRKQLAEVEASKTAIEKRQKKAKLMEILASKQDSDLQNKSTEELQEMIDSL